MTERRRKNCTQKVYKKTDGSKTLSSTFSGKIIFLEVKIAEKLFGNFFSKRLQKVKWM